MVRDSLLPEPLSAQEEVERIRGSDDCDLER